MGRVLGTFFTIALLSFAANMVLAEQAPAWKSVDTDGRRIEFPGNDPRPTILLFWATWCPYCKSLMPHLQSILEEYGSNVVRVMAVQVFDDEDPVSFMQDWGYTFQVVPHGDDIGKLYGVQGTPGLFLVDKDGNVPWDMGKARRDLNARMGQSKEHWQRAARMGPLLAAELRGALDRVLAAGSDQECVQ